MPNIPELLQEKVGIRPRSPLHVKPDNVLVLNLTVYLDGSGCSHQRILPYPEGPQGGKNKHKHNLSFCGLSSQPNCLQVQNLLS